MVTRTYLQSRNRDTDVENKRMNTMVKWGETNWETEIDLNIYAAMYQIDS